LKEAKLATIGAWYSVAVVVMLALAGVLLFGETLSGREAIGLACAIAALILLAKFGS
jgi:multidrug transporter EmrE-like cation transporter